MSPSDASHPALQAKQAALDQILKSLGSAAVAFSGGADSTFLLARACCVLGTEHVLAVTAKGEIYPEGELAEARATAARLGVSHEIIETDPLDLPGFRENPPDRCYICKQAILERIQKLAKKRGLACVCDGANADDPGEHRPGLRAAAELGVRSPLREAGLTKNDIRVLSRRMDLPTWDRPAAPCLATRFPYGQPITSEGLRRVAAAEALLKELGYSPCRVRDHAAVARIEIAPEVVSRLAAKDRDRIIKELKRLSYAYVALDLEGYRPGAMDETLPNAERGMRNAE